MASNVTADGYLKLLECPACEEPCKGFPPYRRTSEYRFPHWMDGDHGTCQCGAELRVEADGERAWLVATGEASKP
jgi:hypothetical protein